MAPGSLFYIEQKLQNTYIGVHLLSTIMPPLVDARNATVVGRKGKMRIKRCLLIYRPREATAKWTANIGWHQTHAQAYVGGQ